MLINNNGIDTEVADGLSLLQYLEKEGLSEKPGIAVALNATVIPRKDWPATILKEHDSLIIIKATQGG